MDFHGLEADGFLHAACGRFKIHIVQGGRFRVPFGHAQVFKHRLGFAVLGAYGFLFLNAVAFKYEGHLRVGVGFGGPGEPVDAPRFFSDGVHVPQIRRLVDPQQHVPENAVVAEHVLVLQVGAVAPAMHHGHQLIFPLGQDARQIEFGGVVAALGIAHELSVHIQVQAAGHAQEGDGAPFGRVLNIQEAAVNAHIIVLIIRLLPPGHHLLIHPQPAEHRAHLLGGGDDRGLKGELIADVHIEGFVVTPELPAGGHVDGVKFHLIGVEILRQVGWDGIKLEIPIAV